MNSLQPRSSEASVTPEYSLTSTRGGNNWRPDFPQFETGVSDRHQPRIVPGNTDDNMYTLYISLRNMSLNIAHLNDFCLQSMPRLLCY